MKAILSLLVAMLTVPAYAVGGGSSVGIGNPAAVNCVKLDGTLELFTTPEGVGSNCVIEQWHLFNEMNKRGLIPGQSAEAILMPNPAALNCIEIKGSIRRVTSPEGESGLCVVEIWDLMRAIDITGE